MWIVQIHQGRWITSESSEEHHTYKEALALLRQKRKDFPMYKYRLLEAKVLDD